jgi:hypothetical protein
VTYVSCDPATLARDLVPLQRGRLSRGGGSPGRSVSSDLPSGKRCAIRALIARPTFAAEDYVIAKVSLRLRPGPRMPPNHTQSTQPQSLPHPREFQLKPTRQPMLWAALAYSSGIVAGCHAWRPASWWIAAAVAFLAARSLLRSPAQVAQREPRSRCVLPRGRASHSVARPGPLDTSLQPFADGQPIELTAHVTREGRLREASPNEVRQSLDVETEQIVTETAHKFQCAGVRLGIYADHATTMRLFRYGERLRLPFKLKLPRNFRNPGAFDYRRLPRSQRHRRVSLRQSRRRATAPGFSGNRIELWRTPYSFQHHRQSAPRSGPRRKPRSSTPWSSAKMPSSIATPESISSAPARITSS